jgi:DNA-binding response OmpR family regulator
MWCLLSEGYWVEPVATSADAALALQRPDPPQVAVIDLGLAGVPGRRLIEHMRAQAPLAHIPVIATSFAEPVVPLPSGVGFVKKPCDPQRLVEKIRACSGGAMPGLFAQLRRAGRFMTRGSGHEDQ